MKQATPPRGSGRARWLVAQTLALLCLLLPLAMPVTAQLAATAPAVRGKPAAPGVDGRAPNGLAALLEKTGDARGLVERALLKAEEAVQRVFAPPGIRQLRAEPSSAAE